ncbi:T9SS type B sorting domain-containing protein [Crocinitomix algicola]|uniref:T9SS type B sorting domain-containing protein n=1 Tax=Crocinitomix algicola TaxID=1740263 RepID=UPI0009F3D80B|nr:gliding motility-associated C-terminal domain-containing protein [Crocinitomix algicola]
MVKNYHIYQFFLTVIIIFSCLCLTAQEEHMNWHFGNGAGLNFSSGDPDTFVGSEIETTESCYTVNDNEGNVLFYTNGLKVWDATNTVMPNGSDLLGNTSAQCIVLPRPDNPNRYFILSTDAIRFDGLTPNGLVYSEVDMTLNGGLGDIIPSEKNVVLSASAGEWLTAIPHANCTDTWILTHGKSFNSVLMAFELTSEGINPVPINSDLGIVYEPGYEALGIMRPHPDGTKVVMTRPKFWAVVDLFDFDKSTGIASGLTNLYTEEGLNRSYGIEFSRSGNVLYIGQFAESKIFQYDMLAADIPSTRTFIGELTSDGEIGQLQIAPNDKIYVNYNIFPFGGNFLGVINSPETIGLGCDFIQNAVSLGAVTTIYGLPWYYSPESNTEYSIDLGADTVLCDGEELMLTPSLSIDVEATFEWSDGSTGETLNTSEPGTYWVNTQAGSCAVVSDTINIEISDASIESLVIDTIGCSPLEVKLEALVSGDIAMWNWETGDGTIVNSPSSIYTYSEPGTYTIELSAISEENCFLVDPDPIVITVLESPDADFTLEPSAVVLDELVHITDNSTGSILTWEWFYRDELISNDNSFDWVFETIERDVIKLVVTNSNGCSDSIIKKINFETQDIIYIPNTFTPNGDGNNDLFQVVDYYGIVDRFDIYNRWGELVWTSTSNTNGWDGSYNGVLAQDGVYTWRVITTVDETAKKELFGHVLLLR